MRKKLFAVIMSAMMMITFMPAMAFAGLNPGPTVVKKAWLVSGITGYVDVEKGENTGSFVYDGQEHEVTYVPGDVDKSNYIYDITYAGTYMARTGVGTYGNPVKLDKMVAKNAGIYTITATVKYQIINPDGTITPGGPTTRNLVLTVEPRPVVINAKGSATLLKQKVYDGKGIALTDADLNVTGEWNVKTNAYDKANTGLVAGDTLFAETVVTPAEVGVYFLNGFANDKMNKNYVISSSTASTDTSNLFNGLFVQITKATPEVKIASNTLTIKKGYKKAVKFSTNLGTAKLTKTAGNAKITLSNGKLKVAKSLKKGTYKVTVKAAVAESNNWNAAKRVKTLTIVVK